VWLRFLGKESWISSVVISVGTVAAFYVLFVLVLQIPLPRLI
jgi:putative tricarboxylic transport membrane protein